MDAAAAAAMSDPLRNPTFRRRWHDGDVVASLPAVDVIVEPDIVELTGRELLAVWRRERARQAVLP